MHTYQGTEIPTKLKTHNFTYIIDDDGMVSTDDWEKLRHIEECFEIGQRLHLIIQRIDSIDSTLT